MPHSGTGRLAALLAAPVLGVGAMVVPVIVRRPAHWYDSPLFPLIRNAVEHAGFAQLALLMAAGFVLGSMSPLGAMPLGAAAVVLLPLAAIAEMAADPTSHNLWPFEFAIYGFYSCLVAAGVAVAHRLQKRRLSGGV